MSRTRFIRSVFFKKGGFGYWRVFYTPVLCFSLPPPEGMMRGKLGGALNWKGFWFSYCLDTFR